MSRNVVIAREETARESAPPELLALREQIREQPVEIRAELEPLIDEVCEHAQFRGRVLAIAREALERFRLDLTALRFDLEVTRRERDMLRVTGLDVD
jgi:hypothetical protein